MMARGHPPNSNPPERAQETNASKKKTITQNQNGSQNEDFDFWSMPQNDYSKKKKDFVQDSNLWVNQKEAQESAFITEQPGAGSRKKK